MWIGGTQGYAMLFVWGKAEMSACMPWFLSGLTTGIIGILIIAFVCLWASDRYKKQNKEMKKSQAQNSPKYGE